jgi:hypothetical protein
VFLNDGDEKGFMEKFAHADRIVVSFPEGNEPDWQVPTTGMREVSEAFNLCAADLDKEASEATQPFG